ncbi:MAG: hypothetical protein AUI47_11755 [Acidobacteria bacterium 13_1_40CM_2_68_5]|nr:MAG: hypothetical protein AUI47_11755 [Acidobacteria bacterium 13_1_40CM_2_68_5]
MSHDPARVAETREWLQKAALDLRGARIDLDAKPPLLEDALYHCQQAVEKALKGLLAWHDVAFRKTHSLEELGASCEKVEPTLKAVVDAAVPLTRQGLNTARRAVAAVIALLSDDAVPTSLRDQIS